ncbi:MAG: universal stress protein [Kofleriaceae bacterium]
MTFRKILSPIDFSEGARDAMKAAARLAIQHGAELVICHAWYIPPMAFGSEFGYSAALVSGANEDADRAVAAAVAEARSLGVAKVSSHVVSGPPWQQIVELATADPAIDLIVIGTHGRTGLSRMVLGSVAEMVVRHAPCSVLAVPKGVASASFSHAVCAIDFSDSSRLALQTAFELVGGANASVELIHVIEPPRIYSEEPLATDFDRNVISSAEKLLREWATMDRGTRETTFSIEVAIGQPKKELDRKLVGGTAFDLVALGSHGRTGLSRLFLGSVAEHMVRSAGRAVLVARAR